MAMTFNQATVVGHLGQYPETHTFEDGRMIANLSIATSERWTDKRSGEKVEKTEWHRVTVKVDALARLCADYLRKGSAVFIQGKLETRKWQDKSGADRWTTEIVVGGFGGVVRLLDSRDRTGEVHKQSAASTANTMAGPPAQDGIDDEIPF